MLDEFEVEFWETGKDLVDETPSSSQSGGFECRGRHPLQAKLARRWRLIQGAVERLFCHRSVHSLGLLPKTVVGLY